MRPTAGARARAMAAVERELIRPQDRWRCCSRRPSTRRRSIRATSRAIRPASARTAASTRMPRCGRSWPLPHSAKATRQPRCSPCSTPSTTPRTRSDVHRYKVEPYVVAADVYAAAPHVGRGGWTWYTGSAGWMQRAGIESILGLRIEGGVLHLDPCIPKTWQHFEMTVRFRSARYEILVENPDGVCRGIVAVTVDGMTVGGEAAGSENAGRRRHPSCPGQARLTRGSVTARRVSLRSTHPTEPHSTTVHSVG